MAKVEVKDLNAQKVRDITLNDSVWGKEVHEDALKKMIRLQLAALLCRRRSFPAGRRCRNRCKISLYNNICRAGRERFPRTAPRGFSARWRTRSPRRFRKIRNTAGGCRWDRARRYIRPFPRRRARGRTPRRAWKTFSARIRGRGAGEFRSRCPSGKHIPSFRDPVSSGGTRRSRRCTPRRFFRERKAASPLCSAP